MIHVAREAGPARLVLLGGAGHDADNIGLRPALGEVGSKRPREAAALGDRAVHLLRRFRRAQVRQQIGPVELDPVHPARAAGGEERQPRPGAQPRQKLGAFLHDREIGGEIGVKDVVEAKLAQRIDHPAGAHGARPEAEFLADRDPGRRGDLHHRNPTSRIERMQDIVPVRRLNEGAHRADQRALTAGNAPGLGERLLENGDRPAIATAPGKADDELLLDGVSADVGAKAAFDAFRQVAPDARRGVVGKEIVGRSRDFPGQLWPEVLPLVFPDQRLELASAVDLAAQAVVGMSRQQPGRIGAAEGLQRVGVRVDNVALLRRGPARWLRVTRARDLDEAHAAGGMGRKGRMMTERGDVDARTPRRLEQGGTLLDLHLPSVDRNPGHAAPSRRACPVTSPVRAGAPGYLSASATWRFTARKLSGVTEMLSIPACTRSFANSG